MYVNPYKNNVEIARLYYDALQDIETTARIMQWTVHKPYVFEPSDVDELKNIETQLCHIAHRTMTRQGGADNA